MSSTVSKSHWYSVDEVAEILDMNPESVRRWIRAGDIDAHYLGRGRLGGYRITHEALGRFVKRRYPNLKLDLSDTEGRDNG